MLFYIDRSGMCDLSNKVTFEQRSERAIYVDTGGKSIPGRGNSLYKGERFKDQRGRSEDGEGDCGRR